MSLRHLCRGPWLKTSCAAARSTARPAGPQWSGGHTTRRFTQFQADGVTPIDKEKSMFEKVGSAAILATMAVGWVSFLFFQKDVPENPPPKDPVPRCYMDISVGGGPAKRIVMQVRTDVVPKTAENFIALCKGTNGYGYKGSIFHRIVPGFMVQGGDITLGNGLGGKSIYGDAFPDENFELNHVSEGTLGMANAGPDTNGSQFYITCSSAARLNGKHVVFGSVLSGMDVVRDIESVGTKSSGTPRARVVIKDCGVLPEDAVVVPDSNQQATAWD